MLGQRSQQTLLKFRATLEHIQVVDSIVARVHEVIWVNRLEPQTTVVRIALDIRVGVLVANSVCISPK